MTDRTEGRGLRSLTDLLADLDAGLLGPAHAEQVRASTADDPRAASVQAALAATRAELAALPDPPVPPEVGARWDAALAAEAGSPTAVWPHAPADRRLPRRRLPRRRVLVAAGVLAAAAAVAGALWARPQPLPSLDRVELAAAGRAAIGTTDVGPFADQARRAGCLRTVAPPGVAPEAPLLGGRRVVVGGEQAVLLVLGSGELGRFHVVVVDPGCGPGGGILLRAEVVGR